MKLNFLGIRRDPRFSPSHVQNDGEIFRLTAEALRQRDFVVVEKEEKEVGSFSLEAPAVFTMSRSVEAFSRLLVHEQRGKQIINSPTGVLNCYRFNMVSLLPQAGIPFPRGLIVQTENGQVLPGFLRDSNHV
ncbi:MAG: hypothetical protein ACE5H0_00065 [Bacteroidota bacterium]